MTQPRARRCRVCKALSAYPHCDHCKWWVCKNQGCGSYGDANRIVNRREKKT